MPSAVPNLWPEAVLTVDVVTPLAILRQQAGLLSTMTKGMLEGEVTTTLSERGGAVQHQLDVVAPALEGYRHRILVADHRAEMVYPVRVESDLITEAWSATQEEFIREVGRILKSDEVKSLLQSLIARINDPLGRDSVAIDAD